MTILKMTPKRIIAIYDNIIILSRRNKNLLKRQIVWSFEALFDCHYSTSSLMYSITSQQTWSLYNLLSIRYCSECTGTPMVCLLICDGNNKTHLLWMRLCSFFKCLRIRLQQLLKSLFEIYNFIFAIYLIYTKRVHDLLQQ